MISQEIQEIILINLLSDIGEELHNKYDFKTIVAKSKLDKEGNIEVLGPDFRFVYDGRTYDQLEGQGLPEGYKW